MHDLALEEIGHRREPDVRMRPDVDPLAGSKPRRTHVVEEHDRPDAPPRGRGQQARDGEAAEIARASFDDRRDQGIVSA